MDVSEFDMGEGAATAAPDSLTQITQKAQEAIDLQFAIDQMEEDLKAARKALHVIRTSVLPDLMATAGVDHVTTGGHSVKLEDFVSGSLPKDTDKRAVALKWLEENDGAGLIKTQLSLEFGRSQHNEALALADELRKQEFDPHVESSVHPQTLQAFARERIRNGDEIDPDVLGLFVGRVAKFKEIKK